LTAQEVVNIERMCLGICKKYLFNPYYYEQANEHVYEKVILWVINYYKEFNSLPTNDWIFKVAHSKLIDWLRYATKRQLLNTANSSSYEAEYANIVQKQNKFDFFVIELFDETRELDGFTREVIDLILSGENYSTLYRKKGLPIYKVLKTQKALKEFYATKYEN
jgi:hypothetical protein